MKIVRFKSPPSNDTVVMEEDVLPYFYNYLHRHDEMQITLVIKGTGRLIIGNYMQRFSEGDVYVINANQPHIFQSDNSYFETIREDSARAIHIYIDHKNLFNNFTNLPEFDLIKKFISDNSFGLQVPPDHLAHVRDSIEQMKRCSGLDKLMLFMRLLQYLAKDVREWKSLSTGTAGYSAPVSESMRLNTIYEYTKKNYTKNLTLEMISDLCYMTPQAFCKYFKMHTSKTYITFLQEVRVNEACKKIMQGNFDGISSLAYSTGFNSAINFNKVFKKVTGVTPSEYIKKRRMNDASLEVIAANVITA